MVAGAVAILFGIVTIAVGGRTLLGGAEAGAAIVPFVLWFNFLAGFAYVAAGLGLISSRRWSVPLSAAIAGATVVIFAAFALHILLGGAYETRTVGAMTVRSLVWIAIAILAWRAFGRAGQGSRKRSE
jgi:hypothetical protein